MKTLISKYKIAVIAAALLTAACTSDLSELNTDPNAVGGEQFNPNFLLTTAQLRFTGDDFGYETARAQLGYISAIVQHFAAINWPGDKYLNNPDASSAYFITAYPEHVKYIVDVVELTQNKEAVANLHQIARIWKVVSFHRITDIYGDVPYIEAGKGYYDRNFTPAYDPQSEIYIDMLKELEEATAALDPNGDEPSGDMIFNGSVDKWKKFGYSMMLRLGLRLSKVDEQLAKSWVEKAIKGGVMQSIDDNAYILHEDAGRPLANRISYALTTEDELYTRWSKTFIDFLRDNDDPRLHVVAELPSGDDDISVQLGMPNGYDFSGNATDISQEPDYPGADGDDKLGFYSRPKHSVLLKLDAPAFVQTYAEVELMLAEAKKRGWNVDGTTAEHYNAGVTAAMQTLVQFDEAAEIDPVDIEDYLTTHPYVDAQGFDMINTQYWAATILNDYESFANWRRSGFPVLNPVNYPNNATGGEIPRRLIYPLSEASSNGDNYNDAIARMGGNTFLTRVWWDKE